jgi:hydroxymethylpyrimidine/phosphomethylpyrimidine kinase
VVGRREEMEEAAVALHGMGRGLSVVATGGHLEGPDDLVVVGGEMRWLAGERVAGRATHGTGCAFSSALLCGVVEGVEAFEAALGAKKFVAEAMRTASPMGRGRGPLNHLWTLNRTYGLS